jgi:hypothetical protein
MKEILKETESVVIDKILKAYRLKPEAVAETVELYYDAQKLRIMHANKKRSEGENDLTVWFDKWLGFGEKVLTKKLYEWLEGPTASVEAKWAFGQVGIGPIIAAGLAAHIDPARADSVSAVWKFAGLAPGFDRKVKGTKLPYNSRLKTLCWKLGESFVNVSGKPEATYGKLYKDFKRDEVSRNENGLYATQAARELATKKITEAKTKAILTSGKLIDGHLHARAKRRTVKIFLEHYWLIARKARGLPVREPYAIAILNHDGKIEV